MYHFTITVKGTAQSTADAHHLARDIQSTIARYKLTAQVGMQVEDKPPIEEEEQ